jgi:hypothetical protein
MNRDSCSGKQQPERDTCTYQSADGYQQGKQSHGQNGSKGNSKVELHLTRTEEHDEYDARHEDEELSRLEHN